MRHGLTLSGRRDRSAVTARCRQMLAQLDLPPQFSVSGFCGAVEVATGRPIVLHPRAPGWGPPGLCGVLASTPTTDHVLYTADGSRIGQATTIVHECGHILFGDDAPIGQGAVDEYLGLLEGVVASTAVRRVRGRSSFTDLEERTVETFAGIVLRSGLSGALDRANAPGARLADRFG